MTIDFMVPHATKMVHFARARKGDFLKVFRAEEATPVQISIIQILLEQSGAASTIRPGRSQAQAFGSDCKTDTRARQMERTVSGLL
ncbi:hypothetical protein PsAD26_01114 [Pseudovibrio sp. Ad26]|nr:hypothetical protein PsAD26_01114 [Pseudovibrio sp. Ad26]